MNLDTFITETIKSLFKATKDCQTYAREAGGRVNPIRVKNYTKNELEGVYFGDEEYLRPLTNIDFDVAVTTATQQEAGIDGGIKVFSVNLGGKDMSTDTNETVSRIKFSIGVVLPHELT